MPSQKPPDCVMFFMCQIFAPAFISILMPSPVLPGVPVVYTLSMPWKSRCISMLFS